MKALILNSGMGTRMGVLASEHPKCMTEISSRESLLSRQLNMLAEMGIEEVIITTGHFESVLVNYCQCLDLPLRITYVKNPLYKETNYIYSIYCAREYLDEDILMMHGDLVFENEVLDKVLGFSNSCMVVSGTRSLPEKDFKAVVRNGQIAGIGIDLFQEAVAAQPLYKILQDDWKTWLGKITAFCESGDEEKRKCYAEEAFNQVWDGCCLFPLDVGNLLCAEVDNPDDLASVSARLHEIENRTVYMSFGTDIIHSGHISIIRKAQRLGKVIIGVLTDEVVSSYKKFPLLPYSERKMMFENISGVWRVVRQDRLSYRENLMKYKPTYLVHGDDWQTGGLKSVRDETVKVLAGYGGRLVEFPYSKDTKYSEIEKLSNGRLALPDVRRGRLKKLLKMKGFVIAIEAHSGLTGLIAEKTVVYQDGDARQFDAMWVSSLCDSTAKGKPDIEVVDMTSRFRTIDDICEVTTKPIIFDGDTGGLAEHFAYTVRSLERMGVSMVIIEDKIGLKKNSLFGAGVAQTQDNVESFCEKIRSGKKAQKTKEFMICARIESLILEQGMDNALGRAFAYVEAGADAVMIHSRKKDPAEIFEFIEKFRAQDRNTPVVVVPTSFNTVTEKEFQKCGVNVVIYANQLIRSGFPAMKKTAESILINRRAKEADDMCMPIKEIISLIPEE